MAADAAASAGAPPLPLPAFELERFFAKHEFSAPHLLCCSDCQPLTMAEVLELADAETKALWESLVLGYTETPGLPALREEITGQYTTMTPDDVTVLAPEEGVYLAMRALLSPGDHVVCIFPGYQSLYAVARSIGCRVTFWEPESEAGDPAGPLTFNVRTLVNLLKTAAASPDGPVKLVVVNFPHNPTGHLPTLNDWLLLVDTCKEYGCYLFSDEMYRGLELDPLQGRLPSACDLYRNAIALSGVSKTLGLPGLRIGWLASKACMPGPSGEGVEVQPQPLQARIRELKDYTTICSSAPSEVLALMALRASTAITTRHLATIRANLQLVTAFFQEFSHMFEFQKPAAGSVAFPRLTTGEDVDAFCDRVVKGCGVLLLPASVYGHPASTARGHFRIGLGRTNLPTCLEHLRQFLREEEGKTS